MSRHGVRGCCKVRLQQKEELAAIKDSTAQQALFDKLLAEQYRRGQAEEVANVLEVAVIDPMNTRATLNLSLNS